MPADLDHELAVLGEWLRDRQPTITGAEIREAARSHPAVGGPVARVERVEVVLDDEREAGHARTVPGRPRRWRTSWLVAAAIVLVCLAAGAFLAITRPTSAPAAPPTVPTDPPGALYVLPSTGSGAEPRNVQSTEEWPSPDASPTAPTAPRGAVVGVPDGDWYRGVVTILVVDEQPEPAGTEGWQQVDRPSGPALTSSDVALSRVAQQRGSYWLLVVGMVDGRAHALDVLDRIDVDDAGAVIAAADADVEVLGTIDDPMLATDPGTYFELADGVTVETATADDPIQTIGLGADARPVLINGTAGWWMTRQDADGVWNALVWMGTPHRVVGVSGHTSMATITDVATDLVIVDETTWSAAVGAD